MICKKYFFHHKPLRKWAVSFLSILFKRKSIWGMRSDVHNLLCLQDEDAVGGFDP